VDAFVQWWETFPITRLYFSFDVMKMAFPIILKAFPVSVAFGVFAFIFAIPIGLALSLAKMAKTRWVRWPATAYIDVVRGTPLFLQILIIYFGLPLLPFYRDIVVHNMWMKQPFFLGIDFTVWFRGLFVLVFNSAAYMAEIFRAGIQSIPKGQMEAARSLGMTAPKAMFFVIIPQTIRRILPTLMSEFILLFKDTALLAAVGVMEMTLRARQITATLYNMSSYMVAAFFYLLVTIPLGRLVANLEARLAASEGGGGGPRPEPLVAPPTAGDPATTTSVPGGYYR
jgi:polar amino acid transport system substrate-binding protein